MTKLRLFISYTHFSIIHRHIIHANFYVIWLVSVSEYVVNNLFNFFRHNKSPPFHTVIRIHLISLSYHILVILTSHFSSMEQMLMLMSVLITNLRCIVICVIRQVEATHCKCLINLSVHSHVWGVSRHTCFARMILARLPVQTSLTQTIILSGSVKCEVTSN